MRVKGGTASAAKRATKRAEPLTPFFLEPPDYLDDEERAQFAQLVRDVHPDHFTRSDVPVLVSFVQATLAGRRCVRDPAKLDEYVKFTNLQLRLASKLRLLPSSRSRRYKTAAMAAQMNERVAVATPWDS